MSPRDFYEMLRSLTDLGRPVAVATVIRSSGSVPRRIGAKMIVAARGETYDTIGGGSFEALVTEDALETLTTGQAVLKRYTFSEQGEDSVGQVCGGTVEVLIEPILPAERLLILGAGHVAQALARCVAGLGLEILVADDRADTLRPELFPPSTRLIPTDPTFSKDVPSPDERTYVAIVTRCHDTDREALARTLSGHPRYVGLIGSQRKKVKLLRELEGAGFPRALLDQVRCPIGLDIGAETPAEIAVAIVAELIRERRTARTCLAESPPRSS